MKEKMSKVITVILSIILWCVILVAALFAFTTLATKDQNHVANLFGFTPMSVQTDSMVPTFQAGDLIIIKRTDPSKLQVGDVVTFHTIIENKYALNTHRITSITDYGTMREFVTKGDNNPIEDSHTIVDGDIVGKYVTKIPFFGKVVDFLSKPIGFLIVVVLPLLIFFVFQVYHLIMVSIQLKKATALEAAEEAKAVTESAAVDEAEKLRKELEEAKRKLAEAEGATPEEKVEEQADKIAEAVAEEAELVVESVEPVVENIEPVAEAEKPVAETVEMIVEEATEPAAEEVKPAAMDALSALKKLAEENNK